jgi:hypothetical protein
MDRVIPVAGEFLFAAPVVGTDVLLAKLAIAARLQTSVPKPRIPRLALIANANNQHDISNVPVSYK